MHNRPPRPFDYIIIFLAYFHSLRKQACGITMLSVSMCPAFQLLDQLTDFREAWYEHCDMEAT
jgi:hypothetical protein